VKRQLGLSVIISAFAVGSFLVMGGGPLLNAFSYAGALDGDWSMNTLGWLFVRAAPWQLPLAQAPQLLEPFGMSAAFTDSIPLMATLSKLASPLLPETFQYFGVWIALSMAAFGVAGRWVVSRWTDDAALQLLGGLFCVLTPCVFSRFGHAALTAQWPLLVLVSLAVQPHPNGRRLSLWLMAFVASVHPYLVAMALPLAFAVVLREALSPQAPARRVSWLTAAGLVGVTGAVMALFGYFSGAPMTLGAEGFGQFSADPFTFANPMGWSRLFKPLPSGPRQYEGLAYLGLGLFALLLVRAVALGKHRVGEWRLLWPLALVCAGLGFYALSNVVTVLGKPVANFSGFYAHLGPLPAMFRSSGRFVWPIAFCLLLGGLSVVALPWSLGARRGLLGAALLLQLADLDLSHGHPNPPRDVPPLQDPHWAGAAQYQHIALVPVNVQWICRYEPTAVVRLSLLATRHHVGFNSGYVGRTPAGLQCDHHLAPGEFDEGTLYVVFPDFLKDFEGSGFECGALEGYPVCVSPSRPGPILDAVRAQPLRR
jgi:hypothetical protein